MTVDKAGTYAIRYGYQQHFEQNGKTQNLYVNDTAAGEAFFPYAIVFGESDAIVVELQEGENTIKIESGEGWTYFDYLLVSYVGDDVLTGDINLDGQVSVSDAVLLQKYLIKSGKLSADQANRADLNQDGVLNAYDLVALKRIMLGK